MKKSLFLSLILFIPLVVAVPDYVTKETKLYLEPECFITQGIDCNDYLVESSNTSFPDDDTIILNLTNLMGDNITNVNVEIKKYNSEEYVCVLTCVSGCYGAGSNNMFDNVTSTWVSTTCTGIGVKGSLFVGNIKFNWTGSGDLEHSKTGILIAEVK